MRKLLFVAIAVAALSSAAMAADIRAPVYKAPVAVPAPSPSWTGFYAGANGGYGWGRTSNSVKSLDLITTLFFDNVFSADQFARSYHQRGAIVGGQAGYNWQLSSQWVAGLEADFQWTDVGDKLSYALDSFGLPFPVTNERKLQWFGTVRSRIGYLATPDLLLFGTAGLAYGKTSASGFFIPGADNNSFGFIGLYCVSPGFSSGITSGSPCYAGSGSRTSAGWTAGGGFEYRVFRPLTAKLEYLHVDLGGQTIQLASPSPPSSPGIAMAYRFNRQAVDIVRVGLNYSFGDWGQGSGR